MNTISPDEILKFWFDELSPKQWWVVDAALDTQIRERFEAVHRAARTGELFTWRDTPQGRLAEIIVLDQFSRNMFRGTPAAFACDPMALALAQEAVRCGDDLRVVERQRAFMVMPYMHSESRAIHVHALNLFSRPGFEGNLDAETRHKAIIDRFGRYPHRNEILGRVSSDDEIVFLREPGSRF